MPVDQELIFAREIVRQFRWAIDACNLTSIPPLIRRVLESGAWRKRYEYRRTIIFDRFSDFITKPVEEGGCGWDANSVEALISQSKDVEALTLWREAMTEKRGGDRRSEAAIKGRNTTNDRKPDRGRAYTLTRLKTDRFDLYERVAAGELSANAAAIEAGYRKPSSAVATIIRLLPKLTPEQRADVRAALDRLDS